ncbi:ABC transporter ATP-binding protein [Fulvimonas soli]|jgi:hypothetical protein|uniref:Membrane protein YqjE n=1 Tax=Fulvimonas soli TaxID=155197 RepID=A0A316IGX9_9GAMM|nr:ABC transporter ATP-binding protein [Fulvimonas soli]PWK92581.1 hypothetical protein C7456_102316 [Fulvimonas soli]TNY27787.1 hypothetical protein BV497_01865 [Fulvimonas soli]
MGEPEQTPPSPTPPAAASGLLDELLRFAGAFKRLFGAQLGLLAAELGLARSAVSWLLVAALGATVAGVAAGLTLLALVGLALAQWFGSWLWALLALLLLELLFLGGAVLLFRRCMHWMSLPATRGEWSAMMRETKADARARIDAQAAGEERAP